MLKGPLLAILAWDPANSPRNLSSEEFVQGGQPPLTLSTDCGELFVCGDS